MAGDAQGVHTPSTVTGLPSEWSWQRIDAVCEGVFDCPHSTPLLTEDGPYLARSQDIRSGVFRTDEAAHVSDATYDERIARAEPRHGDLLYSREGTYFGIAAEVPAGVRLCLGQRMVLIRPHPTAVDFRFLRYWLNSPVMSLHTGGYRDGSVAERLNLPTIRALPVAVPPLSEQRAVAHILGTLDDKIEVNRRMNETLDSMTHALFKSWFVDFDPVHATLEGREPYLSKPLSNFFPNGLVNSELGEIPVGWRIEALGDHFDVAKGVSYKGSGLGSDGVPLHNLNSIYEGGGYKYEGIKYYSGEYADRHVVRPGDLIVANTEQGHDCLLIGYAAIVPALFGDHGIASHHIYRLRPKPETSLTAAFLCSLLNSPQMHDVVSGYANGTTVNMLPIDGLQKPLAICPPEGLVAAFDGIALHAERRREEMISESHTLAALRDTLLPKLTSGEVRVRDAETFIGRVV